MNVHDMYPLQTLESIPGPFRKYTKTASAHNTHKEKNSFSSQDIALAMLMLTLFFDKHS